VSWGSELLPKPRGELYVQIKLFGNVHQIYRAKHGVAPLIVFLILQALAFSFNNFNKTTTQHDNAPRERVLFILHATLDMPVT
jgi:hypothetical protein